MPDPTDPTPSKPVTAPNRSSGDFGSAPCPVPCDISHPRTGKQSLSSAPAVASDGACLSEIDPSGATLWTTLNALNDRKNRGATFDLIMTEKGADRSRGYHAPWICVSSSTHCAPAQASPMRRRVSCGIWRGRMLTAPTWPLSNSLDAGAPLILRLVRCGRAYLDASIMPERYACV